MRLGLLPLLTVTLLACRGSIASAQYAWPGYYASTAGEGYAIGMAAMVSAAGMATLATSKAASNFEDARSKNIDNRVKFTQAYLEQQRLAQSYHNSKRRPPPTSEQLYRWSQQAKPKPLSASELNPVNGAITWPVVLRDDRFDSYRDSTEKFFHNAVSKPETFTYDSYRHLQEATDECLSELKSRINDYRPNDYIHAKKFAQGLVYAAQQM